MITQEQLKECLHYEPETGVFTWRNHMCNRALKGAVAGGLSGYGYPCIRVQGRRYPAHRLAFLYMTGRFPPEQVDHINHVRDDNRWRNLRAVSHAENGKNVSLLSTNTSGHNGVYWSKLHSKWHVKMKVNQKDIHIGLYDSLEDAVKARADANTEYGFHENHGKPQTESINE